jgi:hypothetical protein
METIMRKGRPVRRGIVMMRKRMMRRMMMRDDWMVERTREKRKYEEPLSQGLNYWN